MNDKKTIYLIVGIFVLLVLVSGVGGYFYGLEAGYVSGKSASDKEVSDLKAVLQAYFPPSPSEIFSISGVIKEVGGNAIKVEMSSFAQFPPPPGQKPVTELRLVKVSSETKITEFTFSKTVAPAPRSGNGLPSEVPMKEIKFSDLKIGDGVTVKSSENIKDKMEFTASNIERMPKISPPSEIKEVKTPSL